MQDGKKYPNGFPFYSQKSPFPLAGKTSSHEKYPTRNRVFRSAKKTPGTGQ